MSVWWGALCAVTCATGPVGPKDSVRILRGLDIGVFPHLREDAPTTDKEDVETTRNERFIDQSHSVRPKVCSLQSQPSCSS